MFSGAFSDKGTFKGDGFSFFDSQVLRVAFYGRLYGVPDSAEAPDNAMLVAGQYLKYGDSIFAKLEGSFVVVVWSGRKTVIARDHHGTGPQVYYNDSYYSSSLTELKELGCCTRVDEASLGLFLTTGYIPTGRSSFRGVKKLGAGCILLHEDARFEVKDLFPAPELYPAEASDKGMGKLAEYAQQYASLHERAIIKRIGASRNVGILLSGGYDSGCNLAALRRIYDGEIESYSIGFRGDNWSELPLARSMSEVFGTCHNVYEIDGSEILSLPSIVAHMGDPFVEGGLMVNYAAMDIASRGGADIILGGDGNDQYFGTSAREVSLHYFSRRYGLQPLLRMLYGMLGAGFAERYDKAYRLRFHLDKVLHILHGDVFGIDPGAIGKYFRDPSAVVMPRDEYADSSSFEHLYNQHNYVTDIGKIINQVIVFKATRMAEMFGNRVAFPYLDMELYDFLKTLPIRYKCLGDSPGQIARGNFTSKYLLKYKYKPMLPEAVTSRKKQGGFAPMPVFFEDDRRRALLGDFIMQSSLVSDLLRRDTVEHFLRSYERQCADAGRWFWYRQNMAIQFFNLLTLAVWWEMYVADRPGIRF